MDLKNFKVVANQKIRDCAFAKLNAEVNFVNWQDKKGRMPKEQLYAELETADAFFSSGNVKIDEELLSHCPRVKVIAQASVGYDNIDLAACSSHNIPVTNTPGVLVDAVADHTMALILECARNIAGADLHVKSGTWGQRKPFRMGVDLAGKTLGIVGFGDIGSEVALRAQASKMNVIYHNRHQRSDDAERKVRYVSFDELLKESDFIAICVTLNPSTRGLFNQEAFAKMKQGARLVNISRGPVIDSEALYDALASGKLAWAAADVFDPEPIPGDHKILTLPNITLTPHMASSTKETRDAMAMLTVDNILAALKGENLLTEVKTR
ncbi:MAG: D-glycerate dehydrogenase [Phascolarctobacterium sp.]|nr:D-glycerate dehydrogenase [Phascolarctobacterium sp.]